MPTSPPFTVAPEHQPGFEEWLRTVDTRVFVQRHHGQWYATIEQYDLVGTGQTAEIAIGDALGLLGPYLYSEFADGKTWEQALRPVPWRLRAEFRARHLASRMWSTTKPRTDRHATQAPRWPVAEELERRIEPQELCFH